MRWPICIATTSLTPLLLMTTLTIAPATNSAALARGKNGFYDARRYNSGAPPAARPPRPTPPTRDPHTPGYVTPKNCPTAPCRRRTPTATSSLGPTHNPAPEMTVQEGVPQGTVFNFDHGVDGQQDLSRHRARAQHLRHARSRTIPPS